MANLQHLERLQQGVQRWNQWRIKNPRMRPDLSGATLLAAQLSGINLRGTNLRRVQLDRAELSGADLYRADLRGATLSESALSGAKLRKAKLHGINLGRTNLRGANLSKAHLPEADLSGANLSGANLSGANLSGANLNGANLDGANLSDAWLSNTTVLGTIFSKSLFTGACLQGWLPNYATVLTGVMCEYVYIKDGPRERYPKDRAFKPGEFVRVFQQIAGTVDLTFHGRIDWQAFFQAFQILCQQYAEANLSLQAIEKKKGGAFVVRIEMSPETDIEAIENRAKELYMVEMHALDAQYKQRLRSQGYSFGLAHHSINMERRDKATLMGVLTTMAHSQQGPTYRMANTSSIDQLTKPNKELANPNKDGLNTHHHHPAHTTSGLQSSEPVQAKVIEMLLIGMSPTKITRAMQLKPGQVRFYQQQPAFRVLFWRTFLNKILDLIKRLSTILDNLKTDTQLSANYKLRLMQGWLARFSIAIDYQVPPNVPVLHSEIMHLLLLGMTRREVGDALMIDPSQIDEYRQQPAFRVAFWHAYCHKLLTLIIKATNSTRQLLTNHHVVPIYRLIAIGWLVDKFPPNFNHTLERMELEQLACLLIAIGASQISYPSAPL